MNERIPKNKTWEDLTETERPRIMDKLGDIEERDMQRVLDVYMKISCLVLHDAFHFTEDDLIMFLGNYRRQFRQARKDVIADMQDERLKERLDKIFVNQKYPDDYFAGMFEGWKENVLEREAKDNDN